VFPSCLLFYLQLQPGLLIVYKHGAQCAGERFFLDFSLTVWPLVDYFSRQAFQPQAM
jgi:hypothetical protein